MKKELVYTIGVTLYGWCFNPCSNGMKKEQTATAQNQSEVSFNPCSNGMKKELMYLQPLHLLLLRFNPCSNGMKKEQVYV